MLLAAVAGVMTMPAAATAHSRTTATIFQAFAPDGAPTLNTRPKSGSCWTGALTIARSDAWRCLVGNYIYDPCFSSSQAQGVVICPNLQVNGGVEIHLTKRLPRGMGNTGTPSLNDQPWNIQLTNGHHCMLSSGATNVVHGKRLNYFCGGGLKYGLWGFPRRNGEPWTILVGPFTATSLHAQRSIRAVWT
jgi:hypothetical protein